MRTFFPIRLPVMRFLILIIELFFRMMLYSISLFLISTSSWMEVNGPIKEFSISVLEPIITGPRMTLFLTTAPF